MAVRKLVAIPRISAKAFRAMKGEREPSYRVVLQNEDGDFELGAAWRKTSDRGVAYLSVMLDDPAFPARCGAALCQTASKFDPVSASNFDPRRVLTVAVAPSELVGVAETARARVVG